MKLWYDKKSKDPTYFIQRGIRNGKKTTTKNMINIGKYSELLKTATDPPKYANMYITSGFDNSQTTAIHLIIPNF